MQMNAIKQDLFSVNNIFFTFLKKCFCQCVVIKCLLSKREICKIDVDIYSGIKQTIQCVIGRNACSQTKDGTTINFFYKCHSLNYLHFSH